MTSHMNNMKFVLYETYYVLSLQIKWYTCQTKTKSQKINREKFSIVLLILNDEMFFLFHLSLIKC